VNLAYRLTVGLVGLILLVGAGTVAFVLVEGAEPFDALWMVMITISTIGFGEVFPLSAGGRVITMLLMVSGIGLVFYTAAAAIEQLFIFRTRQGKARIMTGVRHLSNHVILCGLGKVGAGSFAALTSRAVDVVAIEINPERAQQAQEEGLLVIEGDATSNEMLLAAGINRARALIACVTDDADNLVIVLSARALAPEIHVVSRASELEWQEKLKLAGADRVVAPQVVGSERLAAMAVEPSLAEYFDIVVGGRPIEFVVEEVLVSQECEVVGKTLRDSGIRESTGATVLAVEDRERGSLTTPSPDRVIQADTTVILVGMPEQVTAALTLLRPWRPGG
jgi:voltage-gated potassium channel